MPIPDYQTLMLPVLKKSAQGEIKINQAISEIADEYGLTDDEKAFKVTASGCASLRIAQHGKLGW